MIRKFLAFIALAVFGMPMLAGCGLIIPLAIVAVETAVEQGTPVIVEDIAAASRSTARKEDPPVDPEDVKP